MKYDVVEARYMGGYVIWLRFRDNTSGEIDLEKGLYGPMFEPLRDLTVFKRFNPDRVGINRPASQNGEKAEKKRKLTNHNVLSI